MSHQEKPYASSSISEITSPCWLPSGAFSNPGVSADLAVQGSAGNSAVLRELELRYLEDASSFGGVRDSFSCSLRGGTGPSGLEKIGAVEEYGSEEGLSRLTRCERMLSQNLKRWHSSERLGSGEADVRWMKRRRESGDDGFMATDR